ncbi:GTPase HflX [Candidatus Geothermarchaeota archaeon]|nr:MAG: GTPase HflX [Candidatus Geothermarchaeota archaeon]RLG62972.1 MAG: GTPase HflX [Candidatus Geothermarchaeota archaeon]HEW93694.1 GTPase HflX [Thermoprotei archaeon]
MSVRRVNKRAIVVVYKRESYKEFESLVKEAGYEIVGIVYLRRFTSRGISDYKINEIKSLMESTGAENVIFDTQLKPNYIYNIAKELGVEPKDRLEIILEIFKMHSPSKEADLQIKLASLQIELARAKERVKLAKLGEQPALVLGPGEYEVDVYYNEVKRRIQNIKAKLEEERKKRELHREYRRKRGFRTISIAGYTSSGKTTLFNALTGLNRRTGPEPFTTISTKFSIIKIGVWDIYLVDTIGFITDLPPFMINAFYSTLEEITYSDLVLLVVDVSEPYDYIKNKLEASYEILRKLNYNGNVVIVGNKIDVINNIEYLKPIESLFNSYSNYYIFISALKGINLDGLLEIIEDILGRGRYIKVRVSYSNPNWYNILDYLKRNSDREFSLSFENDSIIVEGLFNDRAIEYIKKNRIEVLEGLPHAEDMDIEAES